MEIMIFVISAALVWSLPGMALADKPVPPETTRIATIPNLITILRFMLVIPFASLASRGEDGLALVVVFLAGVTDTLDGYLARRMGQRSKWGRLADPLADKLLMGAAYGILAFFRGAQPAIPAWVAIAVIGRDVLILGGAMVVYIAVRSTGFEPTFFGKLNTFLEIAALIFSLGAARSPGLQAFLNPFYYLLLISILISGVDYVRQGLRMLRRF